MPRLFHPKTRLVRRREACYRLGISPRSFDRHWASVFTDPRDPEFQSAGNLRMVFSDELDAAVNAGGGRKGRIAVLNIRGKLNRKESA